MMPAPDWKEVVAKAMNAAGDHPEVFLQALLVRLGDCPAAWPAIRGAADDHATYLRAAIMREIEANDAAAQDAAARLDAILRRPTE